MFFFPCDSILLGIFVICVFLYYALKGMGENQNKESDEEKEKRWAKFCEQWRLEKDPENIRYQNWLYRHRPKE